MIAVYLIIIACFNFVDFSLFLLDYCCWGFNFTLEHFQIKLIVGCLFRGRKKRRTTQDWVNLKRKMLQCLREGEDVVRIRAGDEGNLARKSYGGPSAPANTMGERAGDWCCWSQIDASRKLVMMTKGSGLRRNIALSNCVECEAGDSVDQVFILWT